MRRASLSIVLCLLLSAAWVQAGTHTITLSAAQEATVALVAAQRQTPAATVVQQAAERGLAQAGAQALEQAESLLLQQFRTLTPADKTAIEQEVQTRRPR